MDDEKDVKFSLRFKRALKKVAEMDNPNEALSIEDILDEEDLLEKKDLH